MSAGIPLGLDREVVDRVCASVNDFLIVLSERIYSDDPDRILANDFFGGFAGGGSGGLRFGLGFHV